MRKIFTLILMLYLAINNTHAQYSELDIWRKQKMHEYDKWKKMRAEMAGILPNVYQDSISDFINQGFTVASRISADKLVKSNMKVWMIAVGIAAYKNSEHVEPLRYADNDAIKMCEFYKRPEGGSLPDAQIELLTGKQATRANILAAINNTFAKANENDAVIFYFSGHGSKNAFITYEYEGNARNRNGLLSHKELYEAIEKSKARYKYVIADACHAGNFAGTDTIRVEIHKSTFYQAFEQSRKGFAMLLSCKYDEHAREYENDIRQGIFTYCLLKGLQGESDVNKDRVISVIELFDYVFYNVRKYTKGAQNPVIAGSYDDTLPIAIVQ
jgi:uncharacterized caspase-like protein